MSEKPKQKKDVQLNLIIILLLITDALLIGGIGFLSYITIRNTETSDTNTQLINVTSLQANITKEQSVDNQQQIREVNRTVKDVNITVGQANQTINDFVETWFERINATNKINNRTQDQLLNISHTLEQRQDEHIEQSNNITKLLNDRTELFNEIKESVVNLTIINEEERIEAVKNLTKSIEDGNTISKENNDLLKQLLNQNNSLTNKCKHIPIDKKAFC